MSLELWDNSQTLDLAESNYFGRQFATMTDGNVVMVRDTVDGILASILDADGTVINARFDANITVPQATFRYDAPQVVAMPNGGFAVLYQVDRQGSGTNSIAVDVFSSTGAHQYGGELLPPPGSGFVNFSFLWDLAVNPNGTILFAGTAGQGSAINGATNTAVMGATLNSNGTLSSVLELDTNNAIGLNPNAEDPRFNDIVALDDGRFAMTVWERDAVGLTSQRTFDLIIFSEDGIELDRISITDTSDPEASGVANLAFDGSKSLFVTYVENDVLNLVRVNTDTVQIDGSTTIFPPPGGESLEVMSLSSTPWPATSVWSSDTPFRQSAASITRPFKSTTVSTQSAI